MNVFKLLSRSANSAQTQQTHKLPSSGAVTNPQLFGHKEADKTSQSSNKSKKRKRGRDVEDQPSALPADLDFFSRKSRGLETTQSENLGAGQALEQEKEKAVRNSTTADSEGNLGSVLEEHDEDECKRILRSHKLKIVVLEDFAAQEEETKQVKKKDKKWKMEKARSEEKPKKSKTQLYPQPLTSFSQLSNHGVSRKLADNIKAQGYTVPTEVQLGALPLLLGSNKGEWKQNGTHEIANGQSGTELDHEIDLLTIAPTGSGKTITFLIPIINKLLSERRVASDSSTEGPRSVIVAPTKELASQIVNEARKLANGTGIRVALMKKGMEVVERSDDEMSDGSDSESHEDEDNDNSGASGSDYSNKIVKRQKRRRRRVELVKAAILVSTPLALVNALKQHGNAIAILPRVRYLVLDEADVLLDPLFREQTLSIWNACTNLLLQVGLWSATMGSNIESLAISTLNNRWAALSSSQVSLPTRPPLIRLVVGLKDTAIPNITHKLTYAATEQGKLLGLRQLLHPTATPSTDTSASLRPPFLVFTQTIPRAIALHSELLYDIPPEAGGSSRIAVLHADLSSTARENIMTRFRRGEIWVLITTDLLARGVDFRGLNGVVNYDVPNSAAAYVHRVGRTGRAGREGGVAVTFYTREDIPYIRNVANVIRASEKLRGKGEDEASVKQWLLDALPTPTKKDKQKLKKRGVEARRAVKDGEGRSKMRISTKSGYERRVENNRRGAKVGSRRRMNE
ncbi:ATP-dependent RNA helicase-like protein rok1, partial [Zopfia rhizophila CBS 207.26]